MVSSCAAKAGGRKDDAADGGRKGDSRDGVDSQSGTLRGLAVCADALDSSGVREKVFRVGWAYSPTVGSLEN